MLHYLLTSDFYLLTSIRQLTSAKDLEKYDAWVKQHPQGTMWQSVERMEYVQSRNKEARIYACTDDANEIIASAEVVIDGTHGGLCTWEVPRGPIWTDKNAASTLIEYILTEARKAKVLTLYVAPMEALDCTSLGFKTSSRHVHAEATRILDLTLSDETLLAQMHQKGRYNINVARKNGVAVRSSDDIDAYYTIAEQTAKRDGFTVPNKRHLQAFVEHLPGSFLLLAYIGDTPVAGLIGVHWGKTGYYYYGASDYAHRSMMAPYLLQWEAIQLCKKAGCTEYDLLGIAPEGARKDHPWQGISDFKAKFGGTVISYPPEQEITLRPVVKALLNMKRKLIG